MTIPIPSPVKRINPGSIGGKMAAMKMSPEARQARAAKGGNATVRLYGLEHYSQIAHANGKHTWWKRRMNNGETANKAAAQD